MGNSAKLTSCDRVSEIARQFEVEKNASAIEVKRLRRKLADVTNDDNDNDGDGDSNGRPKRRRTCQDPPHVNSDEEAVDTTSGNHSDERFVYQVGHKFFLLHAPWIHAGDDLFDTEVDEHYDPTERFENDRNKLQGQLKEILDLLQVRFQQQALRQRWLRRQVRSIHII